jgi:hypothetical protein
MARFEDLLSDTRAGLPGAPDFIILKALRAGAEELCRESHCWRQLLDPMSTAVDGAELELEVPDGARVEKVLYAKCDGTVMQQGRAREVLSLTGSGSWCYAFALDPLRPVLHLRPVPDRVRSIEVMAVLVPLHDAASLPDELVSKYRRGIVALAKAHVMALSPGMPYHNLQEAAIQSGLGQEWITRAKREQHSGGHVLLRVAPRRFC